MYLVENWGAEYPGHDVLGRPAPVKSLDEGSRRPDVVDRGRGGAGEGNGGGESKDNLVALAPSTFPQIQERFRQFIAQPGFFSWLLMSLLRFFFLLVNMSADIATLVL